MEEHPELPPTPNVRDSVAEAISAGQDLLAHRVELALLDARAFASVLVTRGVLVIIGAAFALAALAAVDLAMVHGLHRVVSMPLAYLLCGAVNLVIAGTLVVAGVLHGRGGR